VVEVATQALEYLVVDGPVTEYLPSGMRAVLPAGTEMSVHVQEDGTARVDFSNEFKNYSAEDEKGILEAITWTLTEFDSIKQVQIMINGYETNVMPVNKTPISEFLSRKDGINVEIASGTNLGHFSAVTLYFKAQNSAATNEYYVPVTRMVPHSNDLVLTTVKELIAGPKRGSGLVSGILSSTEVHSIRHEGDTVVVDFDDSLLVYAQEEAKASDDAIEAVVLSLTEMGHFEQVQFLVNGETQFTSYNGSDLSQPVLRPVAINQTGF
jgi:germination protein M